MHRTRFQKEKNPFGFCVIAVLPSPQSPSNKESNSTAHEGGDEHDNLIDMRTDQGMRNEIHGPEANKCRWRVVRPHSHKSITNAAGANARNTAAPKTNGRKNGVPK